MVATRSSSRTSPLALRTRETEQSASPSQKRKTQPSPGSSSGRKRSKKAVSQGDVKDRRLSPSQRQLPALPAGQISLDGTGDDGQKIQIDDHNDRYPIIDTHSKIPDTQTTLSTKNAAQESIGPSVDNVENVSKPPEDGTGSIVATESYSRGAQEFDIDRESAQLVATSKVSTKHHHVKFDDDILTSERHVAQQSSPILVDQSQISASNFESDEDLPEEITSKNPSMVINILEQTKGSRRKARSRGKRQAGQNVAISLSDPVKHERIELPTSTGEESYHCDSESNGKRTASRLSLNDHLSEGNDSNVENARPSLEKDDKVSSKLLIPRSETRRLDSVTMAPKSRGSLTRFRAGILDGRKRQRNWGGKNVFLKPVGT